MERLRPEVERLKAELRATRRDTEEANPHTSRRRALQERRMVVSAGSAAKKDLSMALASAEKYRFWREGLQRHQIAVN